MKVVYMNLLYDMVRAHGCNFEVVREGMAADPRVGKSHLMPVHRSGTLGSDNFTLARNADADGKRGAGGHCFIKDFAAFSRLYREMLPHDSLGIGVLEALERKNIELLKKSGKDLDLLEGVYGNL